MTLKLIVQFLFFLTTVNKSSLINESYTELRTLPINSCLFASGYSFNTLEYSFLINGPLYIRWPL